MKATIQLTDPLSTNVTLTITMPLKEWKELRQQLPATWPSFKLSRLITDATLKAEKHFTETTASDQ